MCVCMRACILGQSAFAELCYLDADLLQYRNRAFEHANWQSVALHAVAKDWFFQPPLRGRCKPQWPLTLIEQGTLVKSLELMWEHGLPQGRI